MLRTALQQELSDGERPRLIVSEPTFFGVDYIINPWMTDNIGHVDHKLAVKQWNALVEKLAFLTDVEVIRCEDPALPDVVFVANAGSFLPKVKEDGRYAFFCSRFKHLERRGEEKFFTEAFANKGIEVSEIPGEYTFEGDGDLLRLRDFLVIGSGFRTSESFVHDASDCFREGVLVVKLVDPRFYHLDTCFFYHYLAGNEVCLFYPGAFASGSLSLIRKAVHDLHIPSFEVSEAEAISMTCNAVGVNDKVIAHKFSPRLKRWLKTQGFETVTVNLSEFHKAGGSAKCLTLRVPSKVNSRS